MCGILCIFGIASGSESLRLRALECVKKLRHRGPDWSGVYMTDKHILLHERLAIVDVENGAQPLFNEAKTKVLCVNGEIYNHKQLRSELKQPAHFMTESDCEIIIHLYEEQGPNFVNLLNGIFAFALYDASKDGYIIARDHMGICPLYIGWGKDGAMWVASELKALAADCVRFEEFPPGFVYTSWNDTRTQWYKPKYYVDNYIPTKTVDLTELRHQFEAAVVRQLMCDVPYGVLLSGGLDSSLVSSIVCRHAAKRVEDEEKTPAWWPRVHSFSIGLQGSPDLASARKVAKYLDTVHHEFVFTVEQGINALSDVIYQLETFDVTTIRASTPMYLMTRKIKAMGVKMVLSGEGADEVFGGYLYFHKAPNKEEFHKETVRKLQGLHKFDCLRANKSTAAWGVEARVPFLDKEFLDYAMDFDPVDKMVRAGRIEKWVLRKAFEGYLPDEILWRQKEQFSDGVGYGWIDSLKAYAEGKVTDDMFKAAKYRFPEGTPATKEAYLYRTIFEQHYPQPSAAACVPTGPSIACSTPTAILWDKAFQNAADPSGRAVIGVHQDANKIFAEAPKTS